MEEACKACSSTDLIEYTAYWHDGVPYQVRSCLAHASLNIVSSGEFKWLTDMDQQKK